MLEQSLKQSLNEYMEKYPPARKLFLDLEQVGNIYLIGGVLREYRDYNRLLDLRDIDMVVDVEDADGWTNLLRRYETKWNSFGGYKIICSGLIVDIWSLTETWAYKHNVIQCDISEYVEKLTDTVFLNMDGIVYDLKHDQWFDSRYKEAMKSRKLDFVLKENPQILLNIIRAMVIRKRYDMVYSDRLKHLIQTEWKSEPEFCENLLKIQCSRYGKEIFSIDDIKRELDTFILDSGC